MSVTAAPITRRVLTFALALYLLWVLVTYLLEGRILILQRPEATGARLAYALVANILIGIGGSVLVVRFLSNIGRDIGSAGLVPGTPARSVKHSLWPGNSTKRDHTSKNHSPDTPYDLGR